MMRKSIYIVLAIAILLPLSGCELLQGVGKSAGKINLFPVEQDAQLGEQVSAEINNNSAEFPLLAEQGNEEVYQYIRGITNKILNSGEVKYKDTFKWEVKIINDPETLNAFCTPGGYIYVYTGLIKYLDSEDQLAGVMGHEIAHADLRHSTRQMTKIYGISILTQIVTGKAEPGLIEQIALGLVNLKFSRGHETEADEASVRYLCNTEYHAAGAAGFFEKIVEGGSARPPEFISTHPDPGNRVANIHSEKVERGCTAEGKFVERYNRMKALLP